MPISSTRLTDGLLASRARRRPTWSTRPLGETSPPQARTGQAAYHAGRRRLASANSPSWGSRAFTKGLLDLAVMPSHLPPSRARPKQGPLPSAQVMVPAHPQYYEPLGLPSGSLTLRHRLIATAFARRGLPGRVSPVPYQAFAACPLPYPEGVLWVSGYDRSTVCCLGRDMIGSATLPFGAYLTRLQRLTHVGPAALLPLLEPYSSATAFDAPLRRADLSARPEPATRLDRPITAVGLTPQVWYSNPPHYEPRGQDAPRAIRTRFRRRAGRLTAVESLK
jgi:hypothetical protein